MHHFSLLITLLLLFLLNAFTKAATSNNNQLKTMTRLSINCGSAATSAALNGREWIGDIRPKGSSLLQIKGSSTASTVTHSSISTDQAPHKTARISASQFSYAFRVSPGEKILRLHFNAAPYKGFKRFRDLFTVEAGPFTLLSNFSASLTAAALGVNTFAKEFCISIQQNQTLSIIFSAVNSQSGDSKYAFINGIEIISVPLRLSHFRGGDHRAQVVGQKSRVYIENSTALELAHRVNMKHDSVSFSDEIFDDKAKENQINEHTWGTPVDVGFRYLVRIYFYDIGLHLKVLIDEMIVDTNISIQRDDEYGILEYRDYVVPVKGRKVEGKRDLLISMQTDDEFADGHQVIKGFEVFKLSNPDNSLASPNAFPPRRDFPSWTISNLLPILSQGNGAATLGIAMLALLNIIVHKFRGIYESRSITEEENRPSAKAERLCRRFSLAEIRSATKNFSEGLLIGRGGFGNVYKGFLDNGRQTVAVKRLKSNSRQGKHEFLTEIETLCELRHINLVSLIGYCSDRKEMILVYEYMPSGTLADHLHKYAKEGNGSCSLTWKQRLDICIGTARGLDYLHTGNGLIHRDVKASNILLDENLVPKVSDFGLAKPEDRSKLQSHVSTKVKGTYGYLDPYYHSTRKLTRKSDAYAFGVVLLEVLCERQPMDRWFEEEYCLTRWARNKISEGEVNQIVASSLLDEILPDSLKVFVEVAERCLHDEPKKRPTMAQILVQLEFVLQHQENGRTAEPNHVDVFPSNDMVSPANTEQSAEASSPTKETNSNYFPARQEEWREPKARFGALDTLWNRLKPSKRKELSLSSEICEADIRLPKFEFSRIVAATNHFSSSHKIGIGGYASVYKAVFSTGKTVAVKRYTSSEECIPLFKNEILSVSSLHHRNIIKLHGYCIHGKTGMLLYEFMENGSLDRYIFDEQRRRQLQWSARFKIIIGIAKGVIYLHQESSPKTVHRNLNPTNIFLDDEMNPKISGFAVARCFQDDDQSEMSVTIIAGTIGYIPPEYCLERRISEKTDVYSFGVLVLEILSGKRNSMENLIGDTWKLLTGNKDVLKTVDGYLGEEFSEEEALRCIQVGLLCTQYGPQQRPKMASALKMLLGEDVSLQEKMAQAHCPSYLDPDFADLPNFDYFNPRNCSNERQSYFHSVEPHNMEVDYATTCATDWTDSDYFNPR